MLIYINIGKVTVNHNRFHILILLCYMFRLVYRPEDIKEKLLSTIPYQFYNIYVLAIIPNCVS